MKRSLADDITVLEYGLTPRRDPEFMLDDDDSRVDASLDIDVSAHTEEMERLLQRLENRPDDELTLGDLLGGPDRFAHELRSPKTHDATMKPPSDHSDESMEFTTSTLDVDAKLAEEVLDSLHRRVDEARSDGWDVTQVVIGVPQYKVLLAWTQAEYSIDPEDYLGLDELIVVPGPQMHPVLPNKEMLWKHL